jgi:heterodisulfide reductase subunit B2
MMRYAYYPGCSLEATGKQYEESVRAVARTTGMELVEIEDWNCCGATAYMGVNEVLSFCLTARNLANAAKTGDPVVTPCNACYTNLRKTEAYLAEFPEIKTKVNTALGEAGLHYDGGVTTKHLLQAVVEDVGLEKVKSLVRRPLAGLRVAPYYGCQMVRPYAFDQDPTEPVSLDRLLDAVGATPTYFPMKSMCCGGSLIGTREEVALNLCRNLLLCAKEDRSDCIAVACPLCQMNLDAYQSRINKIYGTDFQIPILYFTQLMGLAFGLPPADLGFQRSIVPAGGIAARYATASEAL